MATEKSQSKSRETAKISRLSELYSCHSRGHEQRRASCSVVPGKLDMSKFKIFQSQRTLSSHFFQNPNASTTWLKYEEEYERLKQSKFRKIDARHGPIQIKKKCSVPKMNTQFFSGIMEVFRTPNETDISGDQYEPANSEFEICQSENSNADSFADFFHLDRLHVDDNLTEIDAPFLSCGSCSERSFISEDLSPLGIKKYCSTFSSNRSYISEPVDPPTTPIFGYTTDESYVSLESTTSEQTYQNEISRESEGDSVEKIYSNHSIMLDLNKKSDGSVRKQLFPVSESNSFISNGERNSNDFMSSWTLSKIFDQNQESEKHQKSDDIYPSNQNDNYCNKNSQIYAASPFQSCSVKNESASKNSVSISFEEVSLNEEATNGDSFRLNYSSLNDFVSKHNTSVLHEQYLLKCVYSAIGQTTESSLPSILHKTESASCLCDAASEAQTANSRLGDLRCQHSANEASTIIENVEQSCLPLKANEIDFQLIDPKIYERSNTLKHCVSGTVYSACGNENIVEYNISDAVRENPTEKPIVSVNTSDSSHSNQLHKRTDSQSSSTATNSLQDTFIIRNQRNRENFEEANKSCFAATSSHSSSISELIDSTHISNAIITTCSSNENGSMESAAFDRSMNASKRGIYIALPVTQADEKKDSAVECWALQLYSDKHLSQIHSNSVEDYDPWGMVFSFIHSLVDSMYFCQLDEDGTANDRTIISACAVLVVSLFVANMMIAF